MIQQWMNGRLALEVRLRVVYGRMLAEKARTCGRTLHQLVPGPRSRGLNLQPHLALRGCFFTFRAIQEPAHRQEGSCRTPWPPTLPVQTGLRFPTLRRAMPF